MSFKIQPLSLSDIAGGDTDFFPLMSGPEDYKYDSELVPKSLPVLPLRNTVLFPGVLIPITVGRAKSLKLITDANEENKLIAVVAQKDAAIEDPDFDGLFKIGVMAQILKVLKMPDDTTTVIIQGQNRIELKKELQKEPYFVAEVEPLLTDGVFENTDTFTALMDSIKDLALKIIHLNPNIPNEAGFAIKNIENAPFLVNFVSSNLNTSHLDKQNLLEITDLSQRAEKLLELLSREVKMLELKNQIQDKVKTDLDKQQRDYLLSQQLKTIQDELGGGPHDQDIKELKEKALLKKWPVNVKNQFEKELDKLGRMHPQAAEYSVQHNYLETLVDLPWNEFSNDKFDLKKAQRILDEDHYGLEKIKERIIEYLAVLKLKGDMKSPILCLVGPPGVGKTSLGKSIARALGREYIRMALGGLRDEAEIRGHRKTYIGAMPGRIIQSLKKAKKSNPVFVLDEIDKVAGNSFNGDPSSALLEVLDPEQNMAFYDNYLELEYDLSRVLFIATANSLTPIQPALRDRMEIIDISGYLPEEKVQIAKRHLVKKQFNEHGLKKEQLVLSNKVIEHLIDNYTLESGVRGLEKNIAKIIRNRAKYIVLEEEYNPMIQVEDLQTILGPPRFLRDNIVNHTVPGIVTGLAWTQVGGKILPVEASLSRGKGNYTMTGSLGDVMKESFTLAHKLLKSKADLLNIPIEAFEKWDAHVHVPDGSTPKDGPSAGITIFTALASLFTGRKVKSKLAMTGEITLSGRVTAVGGIKEKILAAQRAKIKDIILSKENEKDIADINQKYLKGIVFHYVTDAMEVIDIALLKSISPEAVRF
ncbi:MAG: endopeptidase La [Bacteroidales bacterium]|nr:endopeptidase La [Bacteroidales bacterium]